MKYKSSNLGAHEDSKSFWMSFCKKILKQQSAAITVFGRNRNHRKEYIVLTSTLRGDVVGAYRSTTFPSLFNRNFVKFHFMASPNIPPFCDLRNL